MNIPLFNNLIVKPIYKKQVLVSDTPSLTQIGEVIAVGPEVKFLKVGDKIAFVLWGLNTTELDGEDVFTVPEMGQFILFKIED